MEILEIGHFQFVTGLLQFAAGLHAGFALTDSFRNLPKKKFDQFASNWKRISDPETSNTGIKNRNNAHNRKSLGISVTWKSIGIKETNSSNKRAS